MSQHHLTTHNAPCTGSLASDSEALEMRPTIWNDPTTELLRPAEGPACSPALEVYQAPTAEQVSQTHNLIQIEETELEDLNKKHADLLTQLKAVEQEQTRVSESIARRRSSLSRFHSLPHDVLAVIFQSSEDVSPWVWMSLNRMSRAVAMQTRSLWSKLLVSNDADPSRWAPQKTRWASGRERCNTVPRLERALARSAGGKIDVKLDLLSYRDTWITPRRQTQASELITTLQTAQSRIHSLDFSGNSPPTIEALDMSSWNLPNLETAILTTKMTTIAKRIQNTATKLQSLGLDIYPEEKLDWELPPKSLITTMKLRVMSGGRALRENVGPNISSILSSTKQLTHLTLHDTEILEMLPKSTLVLPSLQHLVLRDCTFGIRLSLPRLETFDLARTRFMLDGKNLALPSLKSLKLWYMPSDFCEVINASMLESLDICGYASVFIQLVESSMKKGYMIPPVLKLEAHKVRSNEDDFLTALDSIESLQDLTLHGTGLGKKFFDSFAGANVASKTQIIRRTPICTSLRRFSLNLEDVGNVSTEKAMTKWVYQAVKVRQRSEYPLDEILFKGGRNEEWTPLS